MLTPSSSARSAAAIREMNAVTCAQARCGSATRRARGPADARRGAGQPGQRAEGLAGGDDPIGRPAASSRRRRLGQLARRRARAARRRRPCWAGRRRATRGSAGRRRAAATRATSGSSSEPAAELERAAADVEADQLAGAPAEPAAHGQERQPGLVLAGQHAAGRRRSRWRTRSSTSALLRGVAHRRGGEGQQLVAAELLRPALARRPTAATSASAPSRAEVAAPVDVLGQPQHALVRELRGRLGAAVGVDDEQVHGVGTDVQDTRAACAADPTQPIYVLERVPDLPTPTELPARLSRASGSSSSTRPTPSTSIRADLTWLLLALDVHLRPRLPRRRSRAGPTTAAAATARSSPTRTTRSGCARSPRELTPEDWQFYDEGHEGQGQARRSPRRTRTTTRTGRRTRDRRRRLHLPQPPGLRRRRGLLPARAGPARPAAPARDQARGLLAAAGAPRAGMGRPPRRHPDPGLDGSPSSTAAAGARAATTCTGTAPPRPRPTSAASRCTLLPRRAHRAAR